MNNNLLSEGYEFFDPSAFTEDFSFFFPQIEQFPDISQDLFNFSELDNIKSSQAYQLFDQVFQNYTKEMIGYIPAPGSSPFPANEANHCENPRRFLSRNIKIGTITSEERRVKIEKFLAKRKRRVYTKKISYVCRKMVADTRERYKGRFVSKKTPIKNEIGEQLEGN